MKAVDFDYVRAGSVDEVCRMLDDAAEDGKVIAGGQTLVPLLAMRLTRPALLVDINAVPGLQGIEGTTDALLLGSCTRQAEAERSELVCLQLPLLRKGLSFVGHVQTRNRGTIGGSIANADPSAEIGLVMLTLGGSVVTRSSDGDTIVPADEFFLGPMITTLMPNEFIRQVQFPVWQVEGWQGTGFQETSPRRSDFALASAAVQLVLDKDGICRRAAIGIGGAAATPVRIDAAAEGLVGTTVSEADITAAADVVREMVDPESDLHASADYRRRLAATLAARAIREARAEARRKGEGPDVEA